MRNAFTPVAIVLGTFCLGACGGQTGSVPDFAQRGLAFVTRADELPAASRNDLAPMRETVLYSFAGGSDGEEPYTDLTGVDGALYGTTLRGGAYGYGTIFKVSTTGVETVLHAFGDEPGDGQNPLGKLIDVNGVLYGTASQGGANGYGAVYEVTTSGAERILYSFKGGSDGGVPAAGLIDVDGVLYGTSIHNKDGYGGTAFKITTSGTETGLHVFGDGTDGGTPYTGLTNVDGVLYGTTMDGGENGEGSVYEMTTSGAENVIYSFPRSKSGYLPPLSALTDVDGELYGTDVNGGPLEDGSVFDVTTAGVEHDLHDFGGGNDGAHPSVGRLTDIDGVLYGTTGGGGTGKTGTVFKITTSGIKTTIYRFAGGGDGAQPNAGLTKIGDVFYGTTVSGGANRHGTVYTLSLE